MRRNEISLVLDNPSAYYLPGASLTGVVLINTAKVEKTKGLWIRLEGKAHVSSAPFNDLLSCTDTQTIILLSDDLLGDGISVGVLPAGPGRYPFKFQLPATNLPCSHYSVHGAVEYLLTATLDRCNEEDGFFFDYTASQTVTVGAYLDLNQHPAASAPVGWSFRKAVGIFRETLLTMQAELPAQGYCPGEEIPVLVKFSGDAANSIERVTAMLVQKNSFYVLLGEGRKGIRQYESTIVAMEAKRRAGKDLVWEGSLQLPLQLPPTQLGGGCRIIDLQYTVKVTASRSFLPSMSSECPVMIGTVPFKK